MHRILKLIILLQVIFILTAEVRAQDPLLPSSPPDPKSPTADVSQNKDPVQISADHIIQGAKKESIFAWGRVRIQYQDRILWADKVMLNNNTGIGKAKGHVIILSADGTRMKARQTIFDMKSKQGKLFKAKATLAKQFFITGEEIHRLSANHFQLKQASLTTCTGVLPDWEIQATFADVVKGDRALFTNGILKIRNFPILYIPVGYIPIDQKRKSGFLVPTFGWSDLDGVLFNGAFFWAINRWSDATFYVERSQRGIQPSVDFRYTPAKNIRGSVAGSFLEDKVTGEKLWKVDVTHQQSLPYEFEFTGKLDLESQDSFNQAVSDNPGQRSRRFTSSFANITRSWDNSTLDILARFRESTAGDNDQTFGELPKITYKAQRQLLGEGPFYFNLDTSFASFLTDLDESREKDQIFKTRRFDLNPQLSLPLSLTPWISITPTVGVQWTYYSRGLANHPGPDPSFLSSFSREQINLQTVLEGPRINQVFTFKDSPTKVKHLIEPRFTYSFTPDNDANDQKKIKTFDSVDSGGPQNNISYGITQRLLKKAKDENGEFLTREILRFSVTQSFNIRKATIDKSNIPGSTRRPFSDFRFDLDSRPLDSLILNFDATYNHITNLVNTVNFEVGIKPVDNFWVIMERRWTRDGSNFILGTLDLSFKPGWRIQYSTRFDELTSTFRENAFSLLYDNPCKCWGMSLDIIDTQFRTNDNLRRDQFKFFWNITFRGLGDLGSSGKAKLLHRDFEETQFPQTNFKQ